MGILDKVIKKNEKDVVKDDKIVDDKKRGTAQKKEKKVVKSKKDNKKVSGKAKKISPDKIPSDYFDILVKPHISEKTFNLSQDDQYVFIVSDKANKSEIKKAVKNIYGVIVISVNIINIHSRVKKFRGRAGIKSGYRKAIVKLAKGNKIDLMKEGK